VGHFSCDLKHAVTVVGQSKKIIGHVLLGKLYNCSFAFICQLSPTAWQR